VCAARLSAQHASGAVGGTPAEPRRSFVKIYDPAGFGYGAVSYAGELNSDASEIAGTWTIEGGSSGAFLMVRARRRALARTRKKRTTV
jgi:hypothetical protein